MKCCLEKLIEPLATNKSLEDLFSKLKDGLLEKFDEKISEQNAKIEKLESIISIHENTSRIVGGAVCIFMEWRLKRKKAKMMS